jgi:hypothetical protein
MNCIKICKLNDGICIGCHRTINEIIERGNVGYNTSYTIFEDGGEWCATLTNDFVNIQDSICAFGGTPQEALDNLIKQL